jgi:hypothetical protein
LMNTAAPGSATSRRTSGRAITGETVSEAAAAILDLSSPSRSPRPIVFPPHTAGRKGGPRKRASLLGGGPGAHEVDRAAAKAASQKLDRGVPAPEPRAARGRRGTGGGRRGEGGVVSCSASRARQARVADCAERRLLVGGAEADGTRVPRRQRHGLGGGSDVLRRPLDLPGAAASRFRARSDRSVSDEAAA